MVGYPTAFLVAPFALATFGGAKGHRTSGIIFVCLMTFLYVTGLYMSLTRHEFGSWEYFRNLVFNFFGFYLAVLGFRSIYLLRRPNVSCPVRIDYVMASILTGVAVCLITLAVFRNTPVRVLAIVACILTWVEWKELRMGFSPRGVLYARHARYIVAAYLYVLTVASIVHLGDELSRNLKWLWPTMLGFLLIPLISTRHYSLVKHRRKTTRYAVTVLLLIALSFGGYAMYEVVSGQMVIGAQRM
ncbi:MAG: hypothetical protein DHS20C01_36630 [marine bacterium B5-7]|nr:MAG: hypothetical protein DHS20C01_36630 [marine bacterium B5-7]